MNTEDLNKHQSKDLATKTSNWFSLDCEADQETLTLSLNTNINQCVASLQATGINYIERNQSPKDLNFEIGIIDTKDATKNPLPDIAAHNVRSTTGKREQRVLCVKTPKTKGSEKT